MTESDPRIKGAGIQPFIAWYAGTWGQDRLEAVAARIPEAHRVHFHFDRPSLGVLPSVWYPAPPVHAFLDGLAAAHTAAEQETIVRDGARAIIDATLTGVYRWLFERMMTPDRYAANAQKLFSRYYEPGVMTKVSLGTTGHLTVIEGWGAHHPTLCAFTLHTAVYVYGALGCRDFAVRRTACVGQGASDCRFEMTWSEIAR
jgi:hypothetical protein